MEAALRHAWFAVALLALGQAIWGLAFGNHPWWADICYLFAIVAWSTVIQSRLNERTTNRESQS